MNHASRFVDAGYWIALANARDTLHRRARELAVSLRGPLLTTDVVIVEVGNSLAAGQTRPHAAALLPRIVSDPDLEIVRVSADLLVRAVQLYAMRPDKEWGLTDCISFIVMQDRGITEALAHDHHFVQAGFRALLRE